MTNIEFLPPQFRDQGSARRGQLWHIGVFAAFGGLIAVAAIYQFATTRTLRAQLDAVQPQYELASQKSDRLSTLQKQLDSLEEKANLICYLDHPWPRTQVLSAVVTPLPETIVLRELQIVAETAVTDLREENPHRRAKAGPQNKAKQEKLSHSEHDLKTLRDQHDKGRSVVHLTGTAHDTNALHNYIASLSQNTLVQSAVLTSIEAVKNDETDAASLFQVQLVLTPGFGQIDGPENAVADGTKANQVAAHGDLH